MFAGPPQVLTLPFGPLRTPVADMMRFLELVCFILITCNIIDCSEEEEPQQKFGKSMNIYEHFICMKYDLLE